MEYVNGGELSKYLKLYKQKYQKAFPEEIVQHLMRQIVDALVYIHNRNIIHRDLKLENIMVNFDSEKDKEELNMMKAKIKIIDFGFAILLQSDYSLTDTAVGTLLYMDPKILEEFNNKALNDKNRGYGKEADIWSLGCICYELFRGKYPFEANTFDELVNKINKGKYKLPKTSSKEIISFLDKMLQYDGKARKSARDLRNHPFLNKEVKDFTYMNINDILKGQKEKKGHYEIKNNNEKFNENVIKNYKRINAFPKKPISEEDSFNNNKKDQNVPNINKNNIFKVQVPHYGNPKGINAQPHMQKGIYQNNIMNQYAPPPIGGYQYNNHLNPKINNNIGINNKK